MTNSIPKSGGTLHPRLLVHIKQPKQPVLGTCTLSKVASFTALCSPSGKPDRPWKTMVSWCYTCEGLKAWRPVAWLLGRWEFYPIMVWYCLVFPAECTRASRQKESVGEAKEEMIDDS